MLASGIAAKRPNVWKRNNFVKAKKIRIKQTHLIVLTCIPQRPLDKKFPMNMSLAFGRKQLSAKEYDKDYLFDSTTRYKGECHFLVALSLLLKTTLGANYLI